MPEDIRSFVRGRAAVRGFSACGFAAAGMPGTGLFFMQWLKEGCHGGMAWLERTRDKRLDPGLLLPGVKTIIMLAAGYPCDREQAHRLSGVTGKVAHYARCTDYHDILGDALSALAEDLRGVVPQDLRWFVDSGPVLERDWAQKAGLGFIGKHTNLVCRDGGNWVLLAAMMTTLAMGPDRPERNRCGSCSRCIQACPTGAIVAPFRLDARLCLSYLTIEHKGAIPEGLRSAIGDRVFGCDDCLEACPWNRFAREHRVFKSHVRSDLAAPDLLEWLSMGPAEFESRFRGTPLHRLRWPRFQRNVCVVLGNTGDAAVVPMLEKAAAHPDAMVAEHARWAIGSIHARLARSPGERGECREGGFYS